MRYTVEVTRYYRSVATLQLEAPSQARAAEIAEQRISDGEVLWSGLKGDGDDIEIQEVPYDAE